MNGTPDSKMPGDSRNVLFGLKAQNIPAQGTASCASGALGMRVKKPQKP